MLRPVKRQPAALDQHPAADNVINHQQQEPDGDRRFQPCQQSLRRCQITHRSGENCDQRRANHHVPQHMVGNIVTATFFVEIQRDTGFFQAECDYRQCTANEDKAKTAQRTGKLAVVEIIEHHQRHNQRHNKPDAHQIVAHPTGNPFARPAKMSDKQAVRAGKGGANHHYPQQWHGGRNAIANRHRQRIRPRLAQPVAERHPQHWQR